MVGHEDVGVYPAACLVGIFAQPVKVEAIVLFGKKACLPVVAALDDVKRDIWQGQTGAAWHRGALEKMTS